MNNRPRRLPQFQKAWLTREQAEEQGYRPHFGPLSEIEYWMVQGNPLGTGIEPDLIKAGRDYCGVILTRKAIEIWTK